jgi:small nuclear ribonucleoprotein (snRNP)-like protein
MVLTVALVCMSAVMIVLLLRPRPQPVVPHEPPGSIMDERLLEYVVVTLKSGTTFGGVLYEEDRRAVVLCKADHIRPDGSKVSADGEIVVFRSDIDFIQRP